MHSPSKFPPPNLTRKAQAWWDSNLVHVGYHFCLQCEVSTDTKRKSCTHHYRISVNGKVKITMMFLMPAINEGQKTCFISTEGVSKKQRNPTLDYKGREKGSLFSSKVNLKLKLILPA